LSAKQQVRSTSRTARKKGQSTKAHQPYLLLRPSPSASSPEQASSQGSAGSVCSPTQCSEPQVRRISAKNQSTDIQDKLLPSNQETMMAFLRLQLNQKHSTVVSGTTPSGCTQRAPTGLKKIDCPQSTGYSFIRHGLTRPSEEVQLLQHNIKTTVDCQQSTVVSGTTPNGCTQHASTSSIS